MPQVVGVTSHSRALHVPIDNEDRAIAFVQGVVPSAIVTQRHMGALSFNAEQLQVQALQLRFIGFLLFRQHAATCLHTNITCCQRSHFTQRCSCPTSSKRSRAPRLRWRCRTTAYRRPRWSRCLYRSSIRRDAWPEKKIELQPCCNMHIHTYTHTSTFTYTHPLLRSRNHAQSRLVQTPAAATPALARGLHALRPRLHGSIKQSRNTHSEPPAPPPLIGTFYFNQCIRIQALGFRV